MASNPDSVVSMRSETARFRDDTRSSSGASVFIRRESRQRPHACTTVMTPNRATITSLTRGIFWLMNRSMAKT